MQHKKREPGQPQADPYMVGAIACGCPGSLNLANRHDL